jgi:8-oxo-dGTP diphosphatase
MSGHDQIDGGHDTHESRPGWDDDPELVRAAGGVVWRVEEGELQVLLVHRERYDDWSFPKGKLDRGERHEDGALRETEEETGYRCVLGHELPPTRYRDGKGRKKTVRYWEMTAVEGAFASNHETDEARWLTLDEARAMLSYAHDVEVLDAFARFAGR